MERQSINVKGDTVLRNWSVAFLIMAIAVFVLAPPPIARLLLATGDCNDPEYPCLPAEACCGTSCCDNPFGLSPGCTCCPQGKITCEGNQCCQIGTCCFEEGTPNSVAHCGLRCDLDGNGVNESCYNWDSNNDNVADMCKVGTLTLYSDQVIAGSDWLWWLDPPPGGLDVGHSSYKITKFCNFPVTDTGLAANLGKKWGFWPDPSFDLAAPFDAVDGILKDDDIHYPCHDVMLEINIERWTDLIDLLTVTQARKNNPEQYQLSSFDCTTVAIDMAALIGYSGTFNTVNGSLFNFGYDGYAPGQFGIDMVEQGGTQLSPCMPH